MGLPLRTPDANSPAALRGLGPVARMAGSRSDNVKVSFEFFPPKNKKTEETLWDCITKLEPLAPDFVSVTYGAGGSTRERTHRTVTRIAEETALTPASHLTCVGAKREDIDAIADDYWAAGIRHIVALRGDAPDGIDKTYTPHQGGYAYGSDLVAGLKARHDFEISVAAYPDRHPESGNWSAEIDNLKRKVDAGASRAITQFFFSAETFLRYQDRIADAGIDITLVPGLMMQPNFAGLQRMSTMCGVTVPDWYAELFEGLDADTNARQLLTAALTSELTAQLYDEGVNHFHLYTLNRPDIAVAVSRVVGLHRRKMMAG